jgi:hypothetical protein
LAFYKVQSGKLVEPWLLKSHKGQSLTRGIGFLAQEAPPVPLSFFEAQAKEPFICDIVVSIAQKEGTLISDVYLCVRICHCTEMGSWTRAKLSWQTLGRVLAPYISRHFRVLLGAITNQIFKLIKLVI